MFYFEHLLNTALAAIDGSGGNGVIGPVARREGAAVGGRRRLGGAGARTGGRDGGVDVKQSGAGIPA